MTGKKYDTLQTHTHTHTHTHTRTHKVLLHIKINELKFPQIKMGSSSLRSLSTVTICKHGIPWSS